MSILTIVGDNKTWEIDNTFLQPVSSDEFGGAHIDLAVQKRIEQHLVGLRDQGHGSLNPGSMALDAVLKQAFFASKQGQSTFTHDFENLAKGINSPAPERWSGILMRNGVLTVTE